MQKFSTLTLLGIAGLAAACHSAEIQSNEARPVDMESKALISLADSLEPLRRQFNAEKDKPRVLAILSPT